ncbi:MAG TPA: hypothetical protein VL463_30310 [Kofleriaceae bacterium]|jgi:hypothetical protein|nr:hypothetical protein [Kofleriaceae bacterium]
MKKRTDQKLTLATETVRDLRRLDGAALRGVAGAETGTGSCQGDGCTAHTSQRCTHTRE